MNRDSHDGTPSVAFPAMQIVVATSNIEYFVSLLSESPDDLLPAHPGQTRHYTATFAYWTVVGASVIRACFSIASKYPAIASLAFCRASS